MTTAQPTWSEVDHDTATLLDLLADDGSAVPGKAEEWETFRAYLGHVAKWNAGVIKPNDMRVLTRGVIKPSRCGPFYRRACLEGLIVADGWQLSDDTEGRNAGRPARTYRWVPS